MNRARELAREHLRNGRNFVWNATNLSRNVRGECMRLFHGYDARVRLVYVEVAAGAPVRPEPTAAAAGAGESDRATARPLGSPGPDGGSQVEYVVDASAVTGERLRDTYRHLPRPCRASSGTMHNIARPRLLAEACPCPDRSASPPCSDASPPHRLRRAALPAVPPPAPRGPTRGADPEGDRRPGEPAVRRPRAGVQGALGGRRRRRARPARPRRARTRRPPTGPRPSSTSSTGACTRTPRPRWSS